ncbi:MAG: hypothetical protein AAFV88_04170 [Planctomycetota bacterium]
MPLRKLWNSIRGNRESEVAKTGGNTGERAPAVDRNTKTVPASSKKASSKKTISKACRKLCTRIEALAPSSVLEVGVGNATRALDIAQTLTRRGHSTPIHYIAIDPFESNGGSLTLRDFHTQLRDFPVKAHLVPMPTDVGLDRVVRTFGQVDVIVWAEPNAPTRNQMAMLTRLSKPNTVLFTQQDSQWTEDRCGIANTPSRKAA